MTYTCIENLAILKVIQRLISVGVMLTKGKNRPVRWAVVAVHICCCDDWLLYGCNCRGSDDAAGLNDAICDWSS